MLVEFLFEILYVGAPPTCIVCRNYGPNFSMLGPIPNLHIIVS
ncbi:hypothetical protein B7984_13290 [Staphylococcus aureus]|nr:hypothetical protein B7984_13290 [Staphylococcus aureus]